MRTGQAWNPAREKRSGQKVAAGWKGAGCVKGIVATDLSLKKCRSMVGWPNDTITCSSHLFWKENIRHPVSMVGVSLLFSSSCCCCWCHFCIAFGQFSHFCSACMKTLSFQMTNSICINAYNRTLQCINFHLSLSPVCFVCPIAWL